MASKGRTFRFDTQTNIELDELAKAQGLTDMSEVVRLAIHRDYETRFPSSRLIEGKPRPSFDLKSVSEILETGLGENVPAQFYISTGSLQIDRMLGSAGSGIPSGVITHVYGASGDGKTQMGLTLAANASKIGKVLYIDTERGNAIIPRLKEITEGKGGVLANIIHASATSIDFLESLIVTLSSDGTIGTHTIQEIKLIVVDSISSLYRDEMAGNENTQRRNMAISATMSELSEIAVRNHIAVFLTNQVYIERSVFGGFPDVKPYAGNAIRSKSFYTLYIRSAGYNRIARLISSPDGASKEALYSIDNTGIIGREV